LRAKRGADRGRGIRGAGGQLEADVTLDLLSHGTDGFGFSI
jgi:hypothetical protein